MGSPNAFLVSALLAFLAGAVSGLATWKRAAAARVVAFDERLRSDGFLGSDEIRHDGAQQGIVAREGGGHRRIRAS